MNSNKFVEKTKNVYEFISFVMVMLFALLPLYTLRGPQEYYGKLFKLLSRTEVSVMLICLVSYIVFFAFKAYKTSFSSAASDLKASLIEYFSLRKYAILLLLVYVLTVISAFFAPDRQRAFYGTDFRPDGVLMHSAFFALFVFSSALKRRGYKKTLIVSYIVCFFIVSLIMLQQHYGIIGTGPTAPTPEWATPLKNFYDKLGIRVGHFYKGNTGTFYNLNHMGYYACMCSMICTGVFLKSNGLTSKLFSLILCAYSYWILTINDTFGCYIAVFVTLVVGGAVLVFKCKCSLARVAFPVAVFLVVSMFVSFSPTLSGETLVVKNFSVLTKDVKKVATSDEDDAGAAGSGRWKCWVETVDMIKEKPILGYGPDNLKAEYTEREVKVDRAHCEPLEKAVSTGIPSAVFYTAAMILAICMGFRQKWIMSKNSSALMPLLAVAAYFVSSLVGVFLFYTACHFFILLPLSTENNGDEE